jgi:hypothetical protein
MNYYESIVEKAQNRVRELENSLSSFDYSKIEPMISRNLVDNQSLFLEVKSIFNNSRLSNDEK